MADVKIRSKQRDLNFYKRLNNHYKLVIYRQ